MSGYQDNQVLSNPGWGKNVQFIEIGEYFLSIITKIQKKYFKFDFNNVN